jgi:hypothetical protein
MGGFAMNTNQSGAVFGPTLGIARNMQGDIDVNGRSTTFAGPGQGGGDLNGTQATSILMLQAGTNATRWQMPRKFTNPGNWCGIV